MGSSGTIATEMQKVRALARRPIVWVASGSAYVGQRIEQAIDRDDLDPDENGTPLTIAEHLRPVVADAYTVPIVPPGGRHADTQAHAVDALILGWFNGEPSFVHLGSDAAPVEQKRENFLAIGSGQTFAHVAYATLAHYVSKPLPLEQGVLLAYRVISTVCRVSSWGVGPPVQIAVADSRGARVFGHRDMEEIETGVQRWLISEGANFDSSGSLTDLSDDLPTIAASWRSLKATEAG